MRSKYHLTENELSEAIQKGNSKVHGQSAEVMLAHQDEAIMDAQVAKVLSILKKETCMEGHCFVTENIAIMTNPPQFIRTCKHCGYREISTTLPVWQALQQGKKKA